MHQPAEWKPHRATWMAWPCHQDLWQDNLPEAQKEFTDLCRAIVFGSSGTQAQIPEQLEILVAPQKGIRHTHAMDEAKEALAGLPVRFHNINYGDIWLRDTGPLFVREANGSLATRTFMFKGWGGKYILIGDSQVGQNISKISGLKDQKNAFVLEGGAIDTDGAGTYLTTKQCLLNGNRLSLGQKETDPELPLRIETQLMQTLGAEKIIWLDQGLLNDHTDGHVDNLARFVGPGQVICQEAVDPQDPNHLVFEEIFEILSKSTDASGQRLKVFRIPSVGLYRNKDGAISPASYMNFYISNKSVVVPQYGTDYDLKAVQSLKSIFPDREVVGLASRSLLTGGGSFHCITQQEPLP